MTGTRELQQEANRRRAAQEQNARLQQAVVALCAVVQELCVRVEKLEQQQEEETDG